MSASSSNSAAWIRRLKVLTIDFLIFAASITLGIAVTFAESGWIFWEEWNQVRTYQNTGTEVERTWKFHREYETPDLCEAAKQRERQNEAEGWSNVTDELPRIGRNIDRKLGEYPSSELNLANGVYSRTWKRFLCLPDDVDPRN